MDIIKAIPKFSKTPQEEIVECIIWSGNQDDLDNINEFVRNGTKKDFILYTENHLYGHLSMLIIDFGDSCVYAFPENYIMRAPFGEMIDAIHPRLFELRYDIIGCLVKEDKEA